eukprot:363797-Chlamydomonas_euryale.AAC.1
MQPIVRWYACVALHSGVVRMRMAVRNYACTAVQAGMVLGCPSSCLCFMRTFQCGHNLHDTCAVYARWAKWEVLLPPAHPTPLSPLLQHICAIDALLQTAAAKP